MTVSSTYLLRLRLPDQPGVLGRVASALGSAGADIDSIVVVDRAPGYAVDDLVVSLPPGALADRLVSAASSVRGVVVEVVQRHHGRQRMADELELLDDAASSEHPVRSLANGLPDLMHASYALVVDRTNPGTAAVVVAASMSAPAQRCRADWLPLDAPRRVDAEEVWSDPEVAGPDCELAAVPFRGSAALLVGRIGGPAFRPAELTRLAHLARVAQALFAGA
ncbi:MAG TPA: ACT domain-containing protein [Mycobacteriales bacterium]|nr:ACT domain-containing protein [Mycobacteriales bacterium]